jgi:hypothetical protein
MAGAEPIAIVSLCLSVATASFTFYQWWNTQQENRITAAIEVSKNYLKERNQEVFGEVYSAYRNPDEISSEAVLRITRHSDELSYIVFLTNRGRLDPSYLPGDFPCLVSLLSGALKNIKKQYPSVGQEATFEEFDLFLSIKPCSVKLPSPA